eukprot:g6173.t1
MSSALEVTLEVFFDYSSPWTYLAFSRIESLAARNQPGVVVQYRPMLVGGVFNAVNRSVYEARKGAGHVPRKTAYSNNDLQEWADAYGLVIRGPYDADKSKRVHPFPVNSAKALRAGLGCLKASRAAFVEFSKRIFQAYWSESRDISDEETVLDLARGITGLDVKWLRAFMKSDEAKRTLRENTQEVMDRGGFGSPTMFVNRDHMYFGNDRLLLVERRILMEQGKMGSGGGEEGAAGTANNAIGEGIFRPLLAAKL